MELSATHTIHQRQIIATCQPCRTRVQNTWIWIDRCSFDFLEILICKVLFLLHCCDKNVSVDNDYIKFLSETTLLACCKNFIFGEMNDITEVNLFNEGISCTDYFLLCVNIQHNKCDDLILLKICTLYHYIF